MGSRQQESSSSTPSNQERSERLERLQRSIILKCMPVKHKHLPPEKLSKSKQKSSFDKSLRSLRAVFILESRTIDTMPSPLCLSLKISALQSIFNCVQRSHQNLLESLPTFLFTLTLSGSRFPKVASLLGGVFLVGRILFHLGYSSGELSFEHSVETKGQWK